MLKKLYTHYDYACGKALYTTYSIHVKRKEKLKELMEVKFKNELSLRLPMNKPINLDTSHENAQH